MDGTLNPWGESCYQEMGVGIADQQADLEKEHAGDPDLRPSAKQRRQGLANEGLNGKKKKSA
ncbi:MAG: hypothetical protein WAT51_01240 [Holophaga sp.]